MLGDLQEYIKYAVYQFACCTIFKTVHLTIQSRSVHMITLRLPFETSTYIDVKQFWLLRVFIYLIRVVECSFDSNYCSKVSCSCLTSIRIILIPTSTFGEHRLYLIRHILYLWAEHSYIQTAVLYIFLNCKLYSIFCDF